MTISPSRQQWLIISACCTAAALAISMPPRQDAIADSVAYAMTHPPAKKPILARIPASFHAYWLELHRVASDSFQILRAAWGIKDEDYAASFGGGDDQGSKEALNPIGDMGYSGSTFFSTKDSAYLVKSIPRRFESSFFKHDMLQPYVVYMQDNPASLLIRITDFLEAAHVSVGSMLGLAPSHHIIMENILYGQEQQGSDQNGHKWKTWDLKPMSYFYPERDVANGALTSDETKAKLADEFDGKILLSLDEAEEFKGQLQKDTALLARCNAVDYSLFVVRIPVTTADAAGDPPPLSKSSSSAAPVPPAQPPFVPPSPPSWRTGVKSADGRYLYRAGVLDFFWAKHTAHAKAMTGLINAYNLIDRQGPMSVTTTSPEYRTRFLEMCYDIIAVAREE